MYAEKFTKVSFLIDGRNGEIDGNTYIVNLMPMTKTKEEYLFGLSTHKKDRELSLKIQEMMDHLHDLGLD